MARIRTIKPETWTNEKVVACSLRGRLLFIGLLNFADDAGRLPDVPKTIKMQIFPGDDITTEDTHGVLTELSVNRLITRYMVEGKAYIQINGWHHQKINRPNPSKIPPIPEGHSLSNHGAITEYSLNDHCKKTPEGKGRDNPEGKGAADSVRAHGAVTDRSVNSAEAENKPRDMVGLLQAAARAAGIPEGRAVNETATGQRWCSLPYTDEQIVDAIKRRASQPGYKPPRTLAWFTDQLAEYVIPVKPTPIPDEANPLADDFVRMFKLDGHWRGTGPAPDEPGCRVSPSILAKHGYSTERAA